MGMRMAPQRGTRGMWGVWAWVVASLEISSRVNSTNLFGSNATFNLILLLLPLYSTAAKITASPSSWFVNQLIKLHRMHWELSIRLLLLVWKKKKK